MSRNSFECRPARQCVSGKRGGGYRPQIAALVSQGILQQQGLVIQKLLDLGNSQWVRLSQSGIDGTTSPNSIFYLLIFLAQTLYFFFYGFNLLIGVLAGEQG